MRFKQAMKLKEFFGEEILEIGPAILAALSVAGALVISVIKTLF